MVWYGIVLTGADDDIDVVSFLLYFGPDLAETSFCRNGLAW